MKSYFFIGLTAFFLTGLTAEAQKKKEKLKSAGVVQLQDSLTNYGQSDIFVFPNINKTPYYYDRDKLHRIQQLEKSGQQEALYKALREYVSNFGISNFSTNTSLIWQLARLSKSYGPPGEAILLYKLVLKHHHPAVDISRIQTEFDLLTRNHRDYYVPLEMYYEMIAFRKEIDTLRPPHGVLLNMGIGINSPHADYAPTIGHVDTILLFTSKRNQHTQSLERRYDEDLFYSVKEFGLWMDAQEFKSINTSDNEGSACLSADGKYLYFARCIEQPHRDCDIYVAERLANNSWGNVRNLGPNVNSPSWDSHPSLSHSGDTLFFASDRIGGFGMSDLYFSVKDANGQWQKAQNLGPIINTRQSEVSPFFHHTFNVLYFSSNGHPLSFGDFDIYKSYRQNNQWGEPKNVGPLVNGAGSEYYFTMDSKSRNLYYARSEADDKKNLDLFSFPVPMEAQPEAVTQLKGTVTHAQTGEPMQGIVSVIDLDHGVEVAPKFLRPDGSYDFNLINRRNYLLIIQGEEFFRIEETFFMDGDTEINKKVSPFESKIAFRSLEFESGKSDILPAMHDDLAKLGNFLLDHPKVKLIISGHTDSQGRPDANLKLSQARADAIKNYLVDVFRIDVTRITAIGYGGTRPIVEEKTEEDRRLNRRVEFEIVRD
ncbi:MAG: OmpA family protein [Cyclobacteriaceae bacterium]|nr:OmpA family protein [Cyclobacteriaceae bacterium]MDW8330504.1 OmpA family protein [Cyclobacteriaceae bacterium]